MQLQISLEIAAPTEAVDRLFVEPWRTRVEDVLSSFSEALSGAVELPLQLESARFQEAFEVPVYVQDELELDAPGAY